MNLDLRRTALVVLDLQKGLLGGAFAPHSATDLVSRTAALADAVRKAGGTVVLVHVGFAPDFADAPQQAVDQPMTGDSPGKDWFDFPEELGPREGDIVIVKRQWGAFYGTELDLQLRRRGIDTIILAGYATNIAVESTGRDAWERGYKLIFVENACASFSAEMHDFAFDRTFAHLGHVRYADALLQAISGSAGEPAGARYECFAGRNALVHGAGSPVGRAVVRELARLGANVAVADKSAEYAKQLADEVAGHHGIEAVPVAADPVDSAAAATMVKQALQSFGSLHFAVNALPPPRSGKDTGEISAQEWRELTAGQLDGAFYAMKQQAPAIARSGGGAIVNVANVFSRIGRQAHSAAAATGHGMSGLTRSVALEYARQGVRVNSVSPGPVREDEGDRFAPPADTMNWLGRDANPSEIAAVVIFALSDRASYLVGTDLLADGGLSIE